MKVNIRLKPSKYLMVSLDYAAALYG